MVIHPPDASNDTPPAAQASHDERRFLDVTFALGDPERLALFKELMERESPLSCTELAGRTELAKDATQAHLDILTSSGLVEETRKGILRERAFRTAIADVEVRFFGGKRGDQARRRTKRDVSRDARKRARLQKRRERQEARLAKKRAKYAGSSSD